MFTSSIGRALALTFGITSTALAQAAATTDSTTATSELARRSSFSVSFVQSRPQGAFGHNVGLGYGLDGAYLFRLDEHGVWSLRVNAGVASYGDESRQTPLSETVGGRVTVDVTTSNYLVPVSIGPQLSWPTGAVRPYANAGVGALGFVTESSVHGTDNALSFASTTNHSSIVGAWVVGCGVFIPLSVRSRSVDIDVGVQYFRGGVARYLAPGSIVDLPGAQISVTPLESVTHTAVLRIGARVQP